MRSVHKPHTDAYGPQNTGSYPFIGKTADGSGPTARGRDMVRVAQLVRARVCGTRGRVFEARLAPNISGSGLVGKAHGLGP